jgi:hypothetical protein
MAEFHVTVESMWSNDGTYKPIEGGVSETITPTKVKGLLFAIFCEATHFNLPKRESFSE